MKTDDLIKAMAADHQTGVKVSDAVRLALLAGALIAGLAFFATLGFRPDVEQAVRTARFLFKFVVTLSLAATAAAIVLRIGRPGVPLAGWPWALAAVGLVLAAAVAVELYVTPQSAWAAKWIGTNASHCLTVIPLLSVPTLAGLLVALRRGAPAHPASAGALTGLASVGIAATYYASNCTDDSPLFVATWYSLAAIIVVAVGAVAGARLLRW